MSGCRSARLGLLSERLEYRERPYSDVIALLAALYFLTGDDLEGDRHVRVLAGVLAPPTRPQ